MSRGGGQWLCYCRNQIISECTLTQGVGSSRHAERELDSVGIQEAALRGLSSVHSLSRVQLFATPWTAARQASLSLTNSWSLPKLMPIELVMPSNHLILCHPLLLPPSIFPSIRVFSNESALRMRWPKYWSFSINPSSSQLTVFVVEMNGRKDGSREEWENCMGGRAGFKKKLRRQDRLLASAAASQGSVLNADPDESEDCHEDRSFHYWLLVRV